MRRLVYFTVGFLGLGGQVLLLRRALVTFSGNELTVSVTLAAWTAWTGIGSLLGGRLSGKSNMECVQTRGLNPLSGFKVFHILFAALCVLIPLTYCVVYLAKPIMGMGISEAVGPLKLVIMSFISLAPVCLVLGALFPVAARFGEAGGGAGVGVGRAYLWEALGAGAGGLISSAFLITVFKPLSAVFALCMIGAAALAAASKGRARIAWIIVAWFVFGFALKHAPDDWLRSKRWAEYPIIAEEDSRYANLALVKSGGEQTLFVNGIPSITWPGAAPAEEIAHLPMLAHPNPRRILLIGGGLATIGPEILKYPIERLDYCELDPAVIEIERRVSPYIFYNHRIKVHSIDGRRFLAESQPGAYDVIIFAAGDPKTLAANRYFTREAFSLASRALAKPGVLAFATGEYANYIDPLQAGYLALTRQTLDINFNTVAIYPLDRFYFLGGNGVVLPKDPRHLSQLLAEKGVPTRWFRPEIFIPNLSEERYLSMQRAIDAQGRPGVNLDFYQTRGLNPLSFPQSTFGVNSDFHPLGYALWTAYWSTLFSDAERSAIKRICRLGPVFGLCAIVVLLAMGIALVRRGAGRGALAAIVAAMGFSEMVISVSVLYASEVRLGMLFSLMGYLITAMMVGLSLGAYAMRRMPGKSLKSSLGIFSGLLIVLLMAMIPLFSSVLMKVSDAIAIILLTAVALGGSAASGAIYALAARIGEERENRVDRLGGQINMADLLGSAAGAALAGSIMLPLWGFQWALALTSGVMAAGMIVWLAGSKPRVLR